jgi:hypothetical protein
MNVTATGRNNRPKRRNSGAANPVFFMFHYPACVASGASEIRPRPSFCAFSLPSPSFYFLFVLFRSRMASPLPFTS